MMRSPGLEALLESPYIRFDSTAVSLVAKDLEKADKFLKEMPGKKDALEQTNTAYLAMYCAAQALMHSIGYKATNFRCIVTVFEDYFIPKGMVERKFLDFLLRGQKIEGTPQENFEAAEYCVAAAKKALGK